MIKLSIKIVRLIICFCALAAGVIALNTGNDFASDFCYGVAIGYGVFESLIIVMGEEDA